MMMTTVSIITIMIMRMIKMMMNMMMIHTSNWSTLDFLYQSLQNAMMTIPVQGILGNMS